MRAQRQKVHAIANRDGVTVNEPEECLVHQGGGLQRMAGMLARHVRDRDAMQFALNERHQSRQRLIVAAAPLNK
jgi:hypothetical protein